MSEQPEALRLANEFECRAAIGLDDEFAAEHDAARLLREQHADIERLRNDLRNIQFQAELVRDYAVQLYDDCEAAIRARGER